MGMLMLELGVVLRLRDWRPSRLLALLDPLNCGIFFRCIFDSETCRGVPVTRLDFGTQDEFVQGIDGR